MNSPADHAPPGLGPAHQALGAHRQAAGGIHFGWKYSCSRSPPSMAASQLALQQVERSPPSASWAGRRRRCAGSPARQIGAFASHSGIRSGISVPSGLVAMPDRGRQQERLAVDFQRRGDLRQQPLGAGQAVWAGGPRSKSALRRSAPSRARRQGCSTTGGGHQGALGQPAAGARTTSRGLCREWFTSSSEVQAGFAELMNIEAEGCGRGLPAPTCPGRRHDA